MCHEHTTNQKSILLGLLLAFILNIGQLTLLAQEQSQLYAKVKRVEGQGNGGNWLNITAATRDNIMSGAPWKVQTVEYEAGTAPILVRMYNPTDLKDYDYYLKINPVQNSLDNSLLDTAAHWTLEWYQGGTFLGSITSQHSIGEGIEEFVDGHGIAITVKNHPFTIHDNKLAEYLHENGGATYQKNAWYAQPDLVGSLVSYSGDNEWLGGVQDADIYTPGNWIRAGNSRATSEWQTWGTSQTGADLNYMLWRKEDFFNLFI